MATATPSSDEQDTAPLLGSIQHGYGSLTPPRAAILPPPHASSRSPSPPSLLPPPPGFLDSIEVIVAQPTSTTPSMDKPTRPTTSSVNDASKSTTPSASAKPTASTTSSAIAKSTASTTSSVIVKPTESTTSSAIAKSTASTTSSAIAKSTESTTSTDMAIVAHDSTTSSVDDGPNLYHGDVDHVDGEEGVNTASCWSREECTLNCTLRILFSGLAHLGFLAGIIGLLLSLFLPSAAEHRDDFGLTAGLCYAALWFEAWFSQDLQYLWHIRSYEAFKEHMIEMYQGRPEISMRVECYHYETRYRTVYYTDSNGNSRSRTESYQVRVTTHREREIFIYSRCKDASPQNITLDGTRATRVTFYLVWRCVDWATQAAYYQQYIALKERNKYRDVYMDSFEECEIPGFQKRMLAYLNSADRHPCFHPLAYICLSWFILTWPYRWWFKSNTGHTRYTFKKEIEK